MLVTTNIDTYQESMDGICIHLYNRQFALTEQKALQLLCILLQDMDEKSNNTKQMVASLMLHSFNDYYTAWLKKNNYDINKELGDLNSLEHDNYLIAYSSNVYAMEALLEQVFEHFKEKMPSEQVLYYVENYKSVYLM